MQSEHFIIKSDRSQIKIVEEYLNRLNEDLKINAEKFINFQIAVSEAMVNAIIHGNKESNDKKVNILIENSDDYLSVKIKDEGEGFDPDSLPDPTEGENILKESGRGIFIIRSLVDDFVCTNTGDGMELFLRIKKQGAT